MGTKFTALDKFKKVVKEKPITPFSIKNINTKIEKPKKDAIPSIFTKNLPKVSYADTVKAVRSKKQPVLGSLNTKIGKPIKTNKNPLESKIKPNTTKQVGYEKVFGIKFLDDFLNKHKKAISNIDSVIKKIKDSSKIDEAVGTLEPLAKDIGGQTTRLFGKGAQYILGSIGNTQELKNTGLKDFADKIGKYSEAIGQESAYKPSEQWVKDYNNNDWKGLIAPKNIKESVRVVLPGVLSSFGAMLTPVGWGAMFSSTAQDVKEVAIKNGVSEGDATFIGGATAVPIMLLEKLGLEGMLSKDAYGKVVSNVVKKLAVKMLSEPLTEISQEGVQIAVESALQKELNWDKAKARMTLAGLGGFVGGGLVAGPEHIYETVADVTNSIKDIKDNKPTTLKESSKQLIKKLIPQAVTVNNDGTLAVLSDNKVKKETTDTKQEIKPKQEAQSTEQLTPKVIPQQSEELNVKDIPDLTETKPKETIKTDTTQQDVVTKDEINTEVNKIEDTLKEPVIQDITETKPKKALEADLVPVYEGTEITTRDTQNMLKATEDGTIANYKVDIKRVPEPKVGTGVDGISYEATIYSPDNKKITTTYVKNSHVPVFSANKQIKTNVSNVRLGKNNTVEIAYDLSKPEIKPGAEKVVNKEQEQKLQELTIDDKISNITSDLYGEKTPLQQAIKDPVVLEKKVEEKAKELPELQNEVDKVIEKTDKSIEAAMKNIPEPPPPMDENLYAPSRDAGLNNEVPDIVTENDTIPDIEVQKIDQDEAINLLIKTKGIHNLGTVDEKINISPESKYYLQRFEKPMQLFFDQKTETEEIFTGDAAIAYKDAMEANYGIAKQTIEANDMGSFIDAFIDKTPVYMSNESDDPVILYTIQKGKDYVEGVVHEDAVNPPKANLNKPAYNFIKKYIDRSGSFLGENLVKRPDIQSVDDKIFHSKNYITAIAGRRLLYDMVKTLNPESGIIRIPKGVDVETAIERIKNFDIYNEGTPIDKQMIPAIDITSFNADDWAKLINAMDDVKYLPQIISPIDVRQIASLIPVVDKDGNYVTLNELFSKYPIIFGLDSAVDPKEVAKALLTDVKKNKSLSSAILVGSTGTREGSVNAVTKLFDKKYGLLRGSNESITIPVILDSNTVTESSSMSDLKTKPAYSFLQAFVNRLKAGNIVMSPGAKLVIYYTDNVVNEGLVKEAINNSVIGEESSNTLIQRISKAAGDKIEFVKVDNVKDTLREIKIKRAFANAGVNDVLVSGKNWTSVDSIAGFFKVNENKHTKTKLQKEIQPIQKAVAVDENKLSVDIQDQLDQLNESQAMMWIEGSKESVDLTKELHGDDADKGITYEEAQRAKAEMWNLIQEGKYQQAADQLRTIAEQKRQFTDLTDAKKETLLELADKLTRVTDDNKFDIMKDLGEALRDGKDKSYYSYKKQLETALEEKNYDKIVSSMEGLIKIYNNNYVSDEAKRPVSKLEKLLFKANQSKVKNYNKWKNDVLKEIKTPPETDLIERVKAKEDRWIEAALRAQTDKRSFVNRLYKNITPKLLEKINVKEYMEANKAINTDIKNIIMSPTGRIAAMRNLYAANHASPEYTQLTKEDIKNQLLNLKKANDPTFSMLTVDEINEMVNEGYVGVGEGNPSFTTSELSLIDKLRTLIK